LEEMGIAPILNKVMALVNKCAHNSHEKKATATAVKKEFKSVWDQSFCCCHSNFLSKNDKDNIS
jgi:hypothetical protein